MGWSISDRDKGKKRRGVLVPFDIGVVYILIGHFKKLETVLVPFDIGVVYINKRHNLSNAIGFSPLRYWGGLYPIGGAAFKGLSVLVPFDIGVVYIDNN